MGSFANQGGARTLPAGTTSQERFAASQQQRSAIPGGMGGSAGGHGGFPLPDQK